MAGSGQSTALPPRVLGPVNDADASTSEGSSPEAGKPRQAAAPPGSSVAWTAASPAVAAPTSIPTSRATMSGSVPGCAPSSSASALTRSQNQSTRDPQVRLDDTRAHSAIRCACTTERLLVSSLDRNSQITGRPGTTSPKLPAPAHLRTLLAALGEQRRASAAHHRNRDHL